jgi:hypothetical protein
MNLAVEEICTIPRSSRDSRRTRQLRLYVIEFKFRPIFYSFVEKQGSEFAV